MKKSSSLSFSGETWEIWGLGISRIACGMEVFQHNRGLGAG